MSAAAALAVLDVIDDERVLARVRDAGAALETVAARHPAVGEIRAVGLAVGVEIVTDPDSLGADGARARAVRDGLRRRGVLIGTTGRHGNVLKIRPPLAFTRAHVPRLAEALDGALADSEPI